MSWIVDNSITCFQQFCINILKCGPIPKHVAFIMDGNRRYAKKSKVPKIEGHTKGFDKLAQTLQWCREVGIEEVTVYAFSIENFNRTADEVNALMDLAHEKFVKLLEEKERIMSDGVCVRIIGNLDMLPDKLKAVLAEVVLMTKNNKKAFLNIAFAYTSREEMTHSINTIVNRYSEGKIAISDIDEHLLDKCMYTSQSTPPDLLIRTSGEVRLSDFMLWQIPNTTIYFTNVLWPEFTIWDFLKCVFRYQRSYKDRTVYDNFVQNQKTPSNARIDEFLNDLNSSRNSSYSSYLNHGNGTVVNC